MDADFDTANPFCFEEQPRDGTAEGLIFDWNDSNGVAFGPRPIEVADETLRDGLQSPSVLDPAIEDKLALVHAMVRLGIDCAAIGQPASHERQFQDTLRIAKEIADARLPITAYAAARTLIADIEPIVEISQKTGLSVAVAAFVGSSPIRLYAESWEIDRLEKLTEDAVSFAVSHGLPVMYVTEDTTRTPPETLRRLYATAIRCGAGRVCICDTVGHALPRGAAALVRFIREIVPDPEIPIDWHGHRDRGFDLANAFAAWEAGARRCHGTALGAGERCGNTPIEQLLVNLRLAGWTSGDLSALPEYVNLASRALGLPIPANQPVVGADAFRTATGVHAAAVLKGYAKGDGWIVDRVYAGVPARLVGREQEIEIGPLSGVSNVRYYLDQRGLPSSDDVIDLVLAKAKRSHSVLVDNDVRAVVHEHALTRGVHRASASPSSVRARSLAAGQRRW